MLRGKVVCALHFICYVMFFLFNSLPSVSVIPTDNENQAVEN